MTTDWEREYYGANCERLRQMKARDDPHNVFSFEQSVPLSSESTV
ncbi:BBE domain-containing protein [Nocardia pseudovaccinii]